MNPKIAHGGSKIRLFTIPSKPCGSAKSLCTTKLAKKHEDFIITLRALRGKNKTAHAFDERLQDVKVSLKHLIKNLGTQLAECAQIFTDMNSSGLHGINFPLGRTAASADNGAGMSHAPAWRSGQPRNKAHHRFA